MRRPKIIQPQAVQHPWSHDALLGKAQRYAEEMAAHAEDTWQFGLWSALALEALVRAALARVSPALLAEANDWLNLYFALGHTPPTSRHSPKSIDTKAVASRLKLILPDFDERLESFVLVHVGRRNQELHSGSSPFDDLKPSDWLPSYYETCQLLMRQLGLNLSDLVGEAVAKQAADLVAAAKDQSAKEVLGDIAAHAKVWKSRTESEREAETTKARIWAVRHIGHRVVCPSCASPALAFGLPAGPPAVSLSAGRVVEKHSHVPSRFECVACGLKITGLPKLHAARLGDVFTQTRSFEPYEYYRPDELVDAEEPDYNE